ncbi:7609_t:CDS:1, partial [Racocetra fulgida]
KIVLHIENDNRLSNSLTILKEQISGDSIAISDEFELQDLLQFYNLRNIINQEEAFGYESFSGIFFDLKLKNAILQPNIQNLLVNSIM